MSEISESFHIRMYPGDVAVASFEPLVLDEIPNHKTKSPVMPFGAPGWVHFSSMRFPIVADGSKGIEYGSLTLRPEGFFRGYRMRNGDRVHRTDGLPMLYSEEGHEIVSAIYPMERGDSRFNPGREEKPLGYRVFRAFALIPGTLEHSTNPTTTRPNLFASSLKNADTYKSSPRWKLFRGIVLRSDTFDEI